MLQCAIVKNDCDSEEEIPLERGYIVVVLDVDGDKAIVEDEYAPDTVKRVTVNVADLKFIKQEEYKLFVSLIEVTDLNGKQALLKIQQDLIDFFLLEDE